MVKSVHAPIFFDMNEKERNSRIYEFLSSFMLRSYLLIFHPKQ